MARVIGDPSCTECGRLLGGATAADGSIDAPAPGAVSICFYCDALGLFDLDPSGILVIRRLTEGEAFELALSPEVLAAQSAVRVMRARWCG
jgi:hypothetical protein